MAYCVFPAGSSSNSPRGMATFGDYLYYCNFNKDSIFAVAKDGSTVSSPTELTYTLDDATDVDGCTDVHFYIGTVLVCYKCYRGWCACHNYHVAILFYLAAFGGKVLFSSCFFLLLLLLLATLLRLITSTFLDWFLPNLVTITLTLGELCHMTSKRSKVM